ncbi:heat shock protein beta-3 [Discoglossus pictus]
MEGVTIRHWVETPVRYQDRFSSRDLDDCVLENSLFALPGPQCCSLEKQLKEGGKGGQLDDNEKDDVSFKILLDVVQFRPEDIIIQVFEGWLIIKGEHGCRMDEHGFASRSFTRMYQLPDGIQSKDLSAVFCHDGILALEIQK